MGKKLIIGLSAALITATTLGVASAYAKSDWQRTEHRIERLTKALDLTPEQSATLRASMQDQKAARQEQRQLRSDMRSTLLQLNPEAADYKVQLDALILQAQEQAKNLIVAKAQQQEQLYSLLTPEQKAKLPALRAQFQEKWQEKHQYGRYDGQDKHCR